MLDRTPQVFISYSWTSKEYQQKVIDLASRMRHDGVDVKLDVWDLKTGQDKYKYMEQCVSNPEIDRVLILSDRIYAEKADGRIGGVGDETTIISAKVYGDAEQQKFIPVVMERDENGKEYLPAYLEPRMYRDLSGENYEDEYKKLLRLIFEAPENRKPELGEKPDWLVEDTPDALFPVKDAEKKISAAELGKMQNVAVHDFIDAYIEAMKQFYVKNIDNETYLANFTAMKDYRNVFLDHLKAFSSTSDFGQEMADEFEYLYNALYCVNTFDSGTASCSPDDFDIFRIHVWELFVCTMTFMLHFEMYHDINDLLVQYFEKLIVVLMKFCFLFFLISSFFAITKFDAGEYGTLKCIFLAFAVIGFAYRCNNIKIRHDISYEFYLYHMIVINVMVQLGIMHNVVFFFVAAILTLLLSYLSYWTIGLIARKKKEAMVKAAGI